MRFAGALVLLASIAGAAEPQAQSAECATSPVVKATAPYDAGADPFGPVNWYVNADRTIWVAVPDDGWPSGGTLYSGKGIVKGQKTYWVRPAGTDLVINGRRLDATSPAVEAQYPMLLSDRISDRRVVLSDRGVLGGCGEVGRE